jgi:hypothetical protein
MVNCGLFPEIFLPLDVPQLNAGTFLGCWPSFYYRSSESPKTGWDVKQTRFGTLKKVSGKLKRMWSGREEAPASELPMPRLLVVDDEESICFSMSEYF